MLPRITHLPINWQDGMKISKDHFIQSDLAFAEQIRDTAGLYLTSYNYGLMRPGPNANQSLRIDLFFDGSDQVIVRLLECRATTPGGARIEVTSEMTIVQSTIAASALKLQPHEIYIVIDPFQRVAVGQPDPGESPLRQPYSSPLYRLEILPYPQTHQPEWSAFHLCVGRLRSENDAIKLVEQYIPPCMMVLSHQRLVATYHKLYNQLGEIEVAVTGILQRIKTKNTNLTLDQSLLFFNDRIANYLACTMEGYRLFCLQRPPLEMISFFCSFARVINTGLNSLVRKDREEMLDYFHKWFEVPPREIENMLRTLITLNYDHQDTFAALHKVEQFMDRMLTLLKKLNELNYETKRPEVETIYGWIVLHTEGRSRLIFKITEKSLVMGRKDKSEGDVDIEIPDDQWMSRRHARLIVLEENGKVQFQLVDLKSNNGTYIHDTQTRLKPNEEFSLIDGDTFQMGRTNMVIRSFDRVRNEMELRKEVETLPFNEIVNINDLVMG